jgi:hypothetical protein
LWQPFCQISATIMPRAGHFWVASGSMIGIFTWYTYNTNKVKIE